MGNILLSSIQNSEFRIQNFFKILLIICFVFFAEQLNAADIYALHPKPKFSFEKNGTFNLTKNTQLVIPDSLNTTIERAIIYFQKQLKIKIGDTLTEVPFSSYQKSGNDLLVGLSSSQQISGYLNKIVPPGEQLNNSEGYILDVSPGMIINAGYDSSGIFNGLISLLKLMNINGKTASINSAHILDYPDYSCRWVCAFHNLLVSQQITDLNKILDTMVTYKMNGICHTDFKYNILQTEPNYYFDNAKQFKNLAYERGIEIIPGVANIGWSDGILDLHPNLAEGLPTSATYYMESDTGRLIPDSRVTIPNGGFENVDSKGNFTGWSFYDPNYPTQDKTVFKSGTASVKCTNFDGKSASRFILKIICQPLRGYLLSAYCKTQNFNGNQIQLYVAGQKVTSRPLTFTSFNIPATSTGWINTEVQFNTLDYDTIYVYCGAWKAYSGIIWWDDFQIKDLGLTNILRRDGTPLTVKNKLTNQTYQEGIDFEPVVDSIMLRQYGNYGPYHQPPKFKRKLTGNIHNGDSLLISSYHPFTSISDNSGNGSVMVCVSEDTLYSILQDQMTRVNELYYPNRFFMGHDEIRNMNWDSSCLKRNLSPGDLLSDNVKKCNNILKGLNPQSQNFIWSDMFDSLHNAHDDYYLINGDLTGIWNKIPKSLVIANWNGGFMSQSLNFFSKLGFSQITSPYYDVQNTDNMRQWRLAQEGIPNVLGMMYTTWATDYTFLKPFAYFAWGAGPTIYHLPLDSATVAQSDSLHFDSKLFPDIYDGSDTITYAKVIIEYQNGAVLLIDTLNMIPIGNNNFQCSALKKMQSSFSYKIVSTNKQGLSRETPKFIINQENKTESSELFIQENNYVNIYPNPGNDYIKINFTVFKKSDVCIIITDILGKKIYNFNKTNLPIGDNSVNLYIGNLENGTYFIILNNDKTVTSKLLEIVK
ncbi:MAG: T9SS type A sorting domain-containing protein [FCB group bacterium]